MARQTGTLRRILRYLNRFGLFVWYSVMFVSGFVFVLVVALFSGAGLLSLLWALAGGAGFAFASRFTDNSLMGDVGDNPSNDGGMYGLFDD